MTQEETQEFKDLDETIFEKEIDTSVENEDQDIPYDFTFEQDEEVQGDSSKGAPIETNNEFGNWLTKELGLNNGIIKVDVGEEVIERNVNELSSKQQLGIINHYVESLKNQTPTEKFADIPHEKQVILNYLDQGEEGLKLLKEEIDRELGFVDTSDVSDDSLIAAKIKDDFEFLTDEELLSEVEKFKDDPYFDSKMESLRNKYESYVQATKEQEELDEYDVMKNEVEQMQQQFIRSAQTTNLIGDDVIEGGFLTLDHNDPEDEKLINDTLADLFESDDPNDPTPRYIKYLQEPENIYKTALMQKTLPKIYQLVQDLVSENEELKKEKPKSIIGDVSSPRANQDKNNFELEVLDEFTEFKPII